MYRKWQTLIYNIIKYFNSFNHIQLTTRHSKPTQSSQFENHKTEVSCSSGFPRNSRFIRFFYVHIVLAGCFVASSMFCCLNTTSTTNPAAWHRTDTFAKISRKPVCSEVPRGPNVANDSAGRNRGDNSKKFGQAKSMLLMVLFVWVVC